VAFSDPSAADPGNPCPTGYEKVVQSGGLNATSSSACLGQTETGGCIYLCFKRGGGGSGGAVLGLSGVTGNATACPEGSTPVLGVGDAAAGGSGGYDFNPQGLAVKLCVQQL
jgi:hypothetical protein